MKMYLILQFIVAASVALTLLFVIVSVPFSKRRIFKALNRLQGMKALLIPYRILSLSAVIAWVALALPLLDMSIGTNFFTHFGDDHSLVTYFGTLKGQDGDIWFLSLFLGILSVKGHWVYGRMAQILTSDRIGMNALNEWGPAKEMGRTNILA